MMWPYCMNLYLRTHCAARHLSSGTIASYEATLRQFRAYVEVRLGNKSPSDISPREILEYILFLRVERDNKASAVNRQVVILKNFYRALVALDYLQPRENPLTYVPTMRGAPRKLPVFLSPEEVRRLLVAPGKDTVLGLRDRALLALLYGTGIRASECAGINESDIDWENRRVTVTGKGRHQRAVPLNDQVLTILQTYRRARGEVKRADPFFLSLRRRRMSRGTVYQRVRHWAAVAKIDKTVSPHRLRHTFATHLIKANVNLVTLRDLLGHRQLSSTQVYLHVLAEDLKEAADKHPIQHLGLRLEQLLPEAKLPWKHPPVRRPLTG